MAERTEEEKITQAAIKVTLGGREYEIRPLTIRYSSEWRKKSIPLIVFLMRYSQMKPKELEEAMTALFTDKMDEIIESFFVFARELNREEINDIATDGEILIAFLEVFNAFVAPFGGVPSEMKAKLSQPAKPLNS